MIPVSLPGGARLDVNASHGEFIVVSSAIRKLGVQGHASPEISAEPWIRGPVGAADEGT